ncbi:iron complex outermembrane recepter protein [Collimonas sp. OK607]|uniref:hypothetical protein n=1 Tax=Collimonas sp. OK607 TaxID=1798194 RepID=UPI0008E52E86|nr:hypothetical protein [Collimonas sp. OK607]SFA73875.1 iron complex outermembrane recepter protein [Collimonas sp. OK607]
MIRNATLAFLVTAATLSLPASAQPSYLIYAQKLVDAAIAKHSDLTVLAMHVTPPNGADNVIIASNIGRIGKKADADDLGVLNTGKPRIETTKTGDTSVELLMQDIAGKTIGVLGATFKYKAGEDKAAVRELAEKLKEELRMQTPSLEKLFEPIQ